MRKIIVSLVVLVVLSMIGAVNAYALNLTENIVIPEGDLVMMMVLQIILLFIGASLVKIEQKSFGKAIWATLGMAVLFVSMLVIVTKIELGIGFGTGIVAILSVALIQRVFCTTFMKALEAFLFALGANATAIFIVSGVIQKFAFQ